MGAALGSLVEMRELKAEITGLRGELKRFIERANQQHVDAVLADLKTNYAGLFSNHQIETAKKDLSAHMAGDCAMKEKCYSVFMDFLQTTARHIRDDQVSADLIESYRDQMKSLREKGPSDRCDTCFLEVHRLFEKQVDLMQSLGIYEKTRETGSSVSAVPEETIVKEIVDPVANVQRFQILKALYTQTRTFSDLVSLTGLRGGNLLFHIKKLSDSGMILQRHERGDYIITDKGYKTLTAVTDLYRALVPDPE